MLYYSTMGKYIFGPVNSRRFGISLGIDLSPDKKSCNFDCLYCELGRENPVDRIENEPEPDEIIAEVKEFLDENGYPDVLTVTANGEPTLYSKLNILIEELNKIKGKAKTLILSNGSTITEESIKRTLKKFDIVKLSLDAYDSKVFKKIDRPLNEVDIDKLINAMKDFKDNYSGEFIIEILLVKGINDDPEQVRILAEKVKYINPDRVDIGTVDRPPAYRVQPVEDDRLFKLAEYFNGLNVYIVTRNKRKIKNYDLTEKEILETLKKRPLTEQDIESLFSETTKKKIKSLIDKGLLVKKTTGNIAFLIVR